MSEGFEGERAVVVGLGVAGASAARALAAEGATVLVTEADEEPAVAAELRSSGIEVRAGGHAPEHLEGATLVVVSPGVRPDAPVVGWARERGLPVWGELELGARLARVPYLGVTGTNGKTTTTAMLAGCLREAGVDAVACGNIGNPFPEAARGPHDVLVVEASSFQLAVQSSFHPKISVLLNVAPDHLDWHGSFGSYRDAKASVFALQGAGDVHVGNHDDPVARSLSSSAPCDARWFSIGEPDPDGAGIVGGRLVGGWSGADLGAVEPDTPAMRADAAASATAAHAFGAPDDAIRRGLASFRPAAHRGETVAVVGDVRFVDNSKATNPHAVLAAAGEETGIVLIAGGDAKGVDLSPLVALAPRLAMVVALGAAADQLVEVFGGDVPTRVVRSIEEAVAVGSEVASPGHTVLLAPACASWDMFRDYAERGDRFAAAARSLSKEDART